MAGNRPPTAPASSASVAPPRHVVARHDEGQYGSKLPVRGIWLNLMQRRALSSASPRGLRVDPNKRIKAHKRLCLVGSGARVIKLVPSVPVGFACLRFTTVTNRERSRLECFGIPSPIDGLHGAAGDARRLDPGVERAAGRSTQPHAASAAHAAPRHLR